MSIKNNWMKHIELFKKRFSNSDWNHLQCMTFYYEGPESCKNPKQMRYSLGVRVLDNHTEIYNKIKNDGFEIVDLPQVETVFLYLPWRNMLSFYLIGFFWKKMEKYFTNS